MYRLLSSCHVTSGGQISAISPPLRQLPLTQLFSFSKSFSICFGFSLHPCLFIPSFWVILVGLQGGSNLNTIAPPSTLTDIKGSFFRSNVFWPLWDKQKVSGKAEELIPLFVWSRLEARGQDTCPPGVSPTPGGDTSKEP